MRKTLVFQDYRALLALPWLADTALKTRFGEPEFGYESEFGIEELGPWFQYYAPKAETNWKNLDEEGRKAWLREQLLQLEHGDKSPILFRHSGPDFLPAYLYRDDTGNLECNLAPMTLKKYESQTGWVERELGVGSLQAMVSVKRDLFFSVPWQTHLGFLHFFSEFDILERLTKGAMRVRQNKNCEPARNMLHPYLGPLIHLRQKMLSKFLRENSIGNMLSAEDLIRPARRDQSFKFVGSTAYRPDVAVGRVCFEIRDAHKDPELLRNRIARLLFFWSNDLTPFERFSFLPAFDSAAAFSSLPENLQAWLVRVTPFRAPPQVLAFENPRFSYEVYRNFAYPLHNWEAWLEIFSAQAEAYQEVKQARALYLSELEAAASAGESHPAAQRALCRFAESIFPLFLEAEQKIIQECAHG